MNRQTHFLIGIFCVISWAFCATAQTAVPTGSVRLVEFINASASFEVPVGKTWYINGVFSDYLVDAKLNPGGQHTMKTVMENGKAVHIFLKEMNGVIKTDPVRQVYGPLLFSSVIAAGTVPFPIALPERTTFSLTILKGEIGALEPHIGSAYISFVEVSN